ncbi:MAG: GNAT family N-acetyltransferase [Balneolaceae bacterium]|nr:GNAT family N-acetyltransferase [Balneolaceae bacterium]MBO6547917.1 GNAT family N-acetyltransferase [Balneolaceae bacterium]MBO6648430.1 GNAT family N-acetyltransferase [Balneolaceae bacterium]
MSFDKQPTLAGKLLTLRPVQEEDFDALFKAASDPKIWEQHPAWDRYKEPVFRKFFEEALESGGALLAIDNSTGTVIGSSRYYGFDSDRSEIEIGWSFLAKEYWGGRYNKEMKHLMLEHAFQFVDKVLLLIGPDNIRSRKAAEKIGAVEAGTRKNAYGMESLVYEIEKGT